MHQEGREVEKDRHAIDVMQQLKAINAACLEVLTQARADGEHSILLRAVDRIARKIEHWRLDYNHVRPHSSLGNLPPAEFAGAMTKEEMRVCQNSHWPWYNHGEHLNLASLGNSAE